MSLDTLSIYQFCTGLEDDDGRLYLTDYVAFPFSVRPDNIPHTIRDGDTLHGLAAYYYELVGKRPNGWRYWKLLPAFQPADSGVRVHDPTVALPLGRTLWLPSLRTIDTEILAESRRAEHDG
jgi:hypothetical protein